MSASLNWMAWCLAIGTPKVSRSLGVAHGGVEGGPGHADGAGRDVDAAELERAEDRSAGPGRGPSGPPSTVVGRHPVVDVGHLDGLEALVAELVDGGG